MFDSFRGPRTCHFELTLVPNLGTVELFLLSDPNTLPESPSRSWMSDDRVGGMDRELMIDRVQQVCPITQVI